MESHRGFRQGRKGDRWVGNVPLGPEWGIGRGKTGARSHWVRSSVRLGSTTQALEVALPHRKEIPGATNPVCKSSNLHGKDELFPQLFLKMGVKSRAGFSSSPGQASSCLGCPVMGLAGIAESELSIKGGMSASDGWNPTCSQVQGAIHRVIPLCPTVPLWWLDSHLFSGVGNRL